MRMLEQIIQARLFEQLAHRRGRVLCAADRSWRPRPCFPATATSTPRPRCRQTRLAYSSTIMDRITADLRERPTLSPPTSLQRAKAPRVDLFTKAQQTNGYWLTVLTGAQDRSAQAGHHPVSTVPDLKGAQKPRTCWADGQAPISCPNTRGRWRVLPTPPADPEAHQSRRTMSGAVTVNCALDWYAARLSRLPRRARRSSRARGLGPEGCRHTPNPADAPTPRPSRTPRRTAVWNSPSNCPCQTRPTRAGLSGACHWCPKRARLGICLSSHDNPCQSNAKLDKANSMPAPPGTVRPKPPALTDRRPDPGGGRRQGSACACWTSPTMKSACIG